MRCGPQYPFDAERPLQIQYPHQPQAICSPELLQEGLNAHFSAAPKHCQVVTGATLPTAFVATPRGG